MAADEDPGGIAARLRDKLSQDETQLVEGLIAEAAFAPDALARVTAEARRLVVEARAAPARGLDAFLQEFSLTTPEGVALMSLAEALLRIPDRATRDLLLRDKLAAADWKSHVGQSDSFLVNASTWGLVLTGAVLLPEPGGMAGEKPPGLWRRLVARSGEPVVSRALARGMRHLGRQFVTGETIDDALAQAAPDMAKGYRHSYDMLGEAARSQTDAERYYADYLGAIDAIGRHAKGAGPVEGPGLSVKLSALHPRYEAAKQGRVMAELVPRLAALAERAAAFDIGLCVDAEEAERLELSLDVIAAVLKTLPRRWSGFGMAIQAYQTRAPLVVDWLAAMAGSLGIKVQARLVKGAYWDWEIKRAQQMGLARYPVFTRKAATDVSYLACARRLASVRDLVYPQFATHNALSVASVAEIMGPGADYEFQRLHGMGERLHDRVVGRHPVRIYAPVGGHAELLPYLVRRLLENGANTSFVNRVADQRLPVEGLIADPVAKMRTVRAKPHPRIPLPRDLFMPERGNAEGRDLADRAVLADFAMALDKAAARSWQAVPIVGGKTQDGAASRPVTDPARVSRLVGSALWAGPEQVAAAARAARAAQPAWDSGGAEARAGILERAAHAFLARQGDLVALLVREAGKTLADAVGEWREAVDFLRYYAARARADFPAEGVSLPGVTGEANRLFLHGRGVFACISPWNFPLSIFTGQVAAALVAGNAVLAKPAEQTPLVAALAVELLHGAGVPAGVLHFLPGDGALGAMILAEPSLAGVAFTGSTETARAIARQLADRPGPLLPLIAETGGINAMIVDSSALAEQVVADVVASAFGGAGQRCSALRMLYLQDDVAPRLIGLLKGAMDELALGDPADPATDIGPVIDKAALAGLDAALAATPGRLLHRSPVPSGLEEGLFFAPALVELDGLAGPDREIFGPVLHVARFKAGETVKVAEAVAATGYGLTLGVQSRIDSVRRRLTRLVPVGNAYVNRQMVGAVVGAQPFGGEGLSGTGPKAGGPHYLIRFATERCLSVNVAANGGNIGLLALGDD